MKQRLLVLISKRTFWLICTVLVAVSIAAYSFYGVRVEARVAHAGYEPSNCPISKRIGVTVHNYTFHRLARARIELEAWRGNRSKNILTNRWYYFDTVTAPFSTSFQCFSDEAFTVHLEKAPTPVHEETEEERHIRIQKKIDDEKEQERLVKIALDPKSTEYEKQDAIDKYANFRTTSPQPVEASSSSQPVSIRISLYSTIETTKQLQELTAGVTVVVKHIDPEFY
ncbi:hypothetical protein IMW82_16355 [Rhodanobacter sp. B2A1Ga4]|nr:hypothetical protein [Rhodanobacter sp. B2A1Ga4]